MQIQLHPDIETFIGEQVRAGEYRSPDEVVTEALFLLWQHQQEQTDDAISTAGTPAGSRH